MLFRTHTHTHTHSVTVMYSRYLLNTGLDLERVRSRIQCVRHQERKQIRTFSNVQHESAGTEHVPSRRASHTRGTNDFTRETQHCDGTGTRARCQGESKIGKSHEQTRNENRIVRKIIIKNKVKLNFIQKQSTENKTRKIINWKGN